MLKSDDAPSCRASNNVHIWDDSDESDNFFSFTCFPEVHPEAKSQRGESWETVLKQLTQSFVL